MNGSAIKSNAHTQYSIAARRQAAFADYGGIAVLAPDEKGRYKVRNSAFLRNLICDRILARAAPEEKLFFVAYEIRLFYNEVGVVFGNDDIASISMYQDNTRD